MNDNNKKALVTAYYLSRFDTYGLNKLGYENFREAFEDIGKKLQVKPNTIKNMRDEFDPIHNNNRVGWYQRELRTSRKLVAKKFQENSEDDLRELILDLLDNTVNEERLEVEKFIDSLYDKDNEQNKGRFILRGPTGKRAEEIFIELYNEKSNLLQNKLPRGELKDTRECGCGYDFEISNGNKTYFIEVKGLAENNGGILFTNKEWNVAREENEKYYLVLIANVVDSPKILVICDPASKINAKKNIYTSIQVNWTVSEGIIKNLMV